LLDGHLASFLQTLCDAFLSYVTKEARNRFRCPANYTVSLPTVVCRLLYVFCKVRGQKVIVRFFDNEPKYIDPILSCLRQWTSMEQLEASGPSNAMTWEERYIMLLWLSHLMLAPFDLASISSSGIDFSSSKLATVLEGLPSIAQNLLQTAFGYLHVSGKEREAAAIMIVRLVLRRDMQAKQLLPRVIAHALSGLKQGDNANVSAAASAYRYGGLLSLLSGVMTAGSGDDVAPYISQIFQVCIQLATHNGPHETQVRNTAPVRKSLIKVVRLCVLHALSTTARHSDVATTYDLDTMLEETIQYLLESLSDKDTPVRMTASKSLSMVTLSLDPDMSTEVVQAVLASLDENILLQDSSGRTSAITEVSVDEFKSHKKNVSAVDPLQWHGLMLTLGHLLFRRSPPPQQLPEIIAALITGLEFEQRSNVGTSVGVGVRDAACFGVWSLARKYSTFEMDMVNVSRLLPVLEKSNNNLAMEHTALQILANQLVLSACLDPSGNIRRGSSAALQELIGRHPDTILHGIPIVQVVDYHAVARRSKAMIEVSLQAAKLDQVYLNALLTAMLDWRGARSNDAESRRWAAQGIGELVGLVPPGSAIDQCTLLEAQAAKLKLTNTGSNAGTRHGLLLGLSAMLENVGSRRDKNKRPESVELARVTSLGNVSKSALEHLDRLTGNLSGRVTRDLELVLEASSVLVAALAKLLTSADLPKIAKLLNVLERCLTGSEKETVVLESTKAFTVIFLRLDQRTQADLLERWLHTSQSKLSEYKCKGRLQAVGSVFWLLPSKESNSTMSLALNYLGQFIRGQWPIETKINAMDSMKKVLLTSSSLHEGVESLLSVSQKDTITAEILTGLNDYTVDQRGDIGSTLRFKSIEAAEAYTRVVDSSSSFSRPLIQNVARLAAEKLDKLRLQAWLLLQVIWKQQSNFPPLKMEFIHLTDVSSMEYYLQLFELLNVGWLQKYIIAGLVSSAAAGTDDIGRASRNALTLHTLHQNGSQQKSVPDSIFACLIEHLEQTVADDREAIPAMETLAFFLEQQLDNATDCSAKVLRVMPKAHTPTSTIQRLEAATKIYSALCNTDQRRVALDRLTRLLLHRYPKIRADAADTLHLHTCEVALVGCDWTLPVTDLKSTVVQLRKQLQVV
jgi:hypothetical protein